MEGQYEIGDKIVEYLFYTPKRTWTEMTEKGKNMIE